MSTPARITFVTIGARDITTLRAFYERVGFVDLNPDIPDFASFLAGGVLLALYDLEKLTAEADPEGNRWEIAWAPGLTFGDAGEVTGFGA